MLSFNRNIRKLSILLLLFVISGTAQYVNPLKGDIGVHDPVMIKQGSMYYVFATGRLIQYKTSTDRINWTARGSVFSSSPSWVAAAVPLNDGTDYWAPDISFRNNLYWLYYSVSSFGKNTSAIGLATNTTLDQTDPAYKWTDLGIVIKSTASNNYNCIDPNVFEDTDGKLWLTFGSFWSGIKMTELDPSSGLLKSTSTSTPAISSIASRSAGSTAVEAPFIIKHDNFYYLFVSWDACCKGVGSTYKIVVGRSTEVTGPYVDKLNKSMASGGGTIIDTGDSRWKGPGHNGIFIENDTVLCVNHAYDAKSNGAPTMMIRPLYWVDNWPTFIKPLISNNSGTKTGAEIRLSKKPGLILHINAPLNKNSNSSLYNVKGEKLSSIDINKSVSGLIVEVLR